MKRQKWLAEAVAIVAGGVATAVVVALAAWLPQLGPTFWRQLAAFWFSLQALPFWASTFGLNLVVALFAPRTLPDRAIAGGVIGVVYGLLILTRRARLGGALLGLVGLYWQAMLVLGLALAVGAWTGGFLAARLFRGRESAPPWRT